MKKNYIILIISVLVVIAGFLFYWYEYRPNNIRKECAGGNLTGLSALERYSPGINFNKDKYESCLHRNGL
ncbi:MAG: hypothetical protein WC735_01865 [Candidatus Paceibacterota bacterium]|jgi:hypothetical protein